MPPRSLLGRGSSADQAAAGSRPEALGAEPRRHADHGERALASCRRRSWPAAGVLMPFDRHHRGGGGHAGAAPSWPVSAPPSGQVYDAADRAGATIVTPDRRFGSPSRSGPVQARCWRAARPRSEAGAAARHRRHRLPRGAGAGRPEPARWRRVRDRADRRFTANRNSAFAVYEHGR
jgi:hypothetical protein